jgi:hypothetical protein
MMQVRADQTTDAGVLPSKELVAAMGTGKMNFGAKAVHLLLNMDRMIGDNFERGTGANEIDHGGGAVDGEGSGVSAVPIPGR